MKITALIFLLLVSDIYSFNELLKLSRNKKKLHENANDAMNKLTNSFHQLKVNIYNSKIFYFLRGALWYFMLNSGNPILNSILCVVNTYRGYKKYKEDEQAQYLANKQKDLDEANHSAQVVTKDEQGELMVVNNVDENDLNSLDNSAGTHALDEQQEEEDYMLEEDEENADTPYELPPPKKNGIRSFLKKVVGKAKNKFKSIIKKAKAQFEKVKNFVGELFQKPLYHSLLDFSICIIPQILTLAANAMSAFAFAFSGAFVVRLIANSPKVFSNVVSAIKIIIAAKKEPQMSLKYEQYGQACAQIVISLILAFLGTPSVKCPKTDPFPKVSNIIHVK